MKCLRRWFPYADIYGIDIDKERLKWASRRVSGVKLTRQDAHNLLFPDESFNIVAALQLLEHLEKPEAFLREANRILKNNGLLIIATPNPAGIAARLLKEKWHGYIPEHISVNPPEHWRSLLQCSGFHVLEDGTTGLTGFKVLRIPPFSLINWVPMAIFGYFPWYKGESYMAIARKV